MLVQIDDSCARKSDIRKWTGEIIIMMAGANCPFPDDTKSAFIRRLAEIRIRCENCPQGLAGHTSIANGRVTLCNGNITKRTLFHELVHAMGGRELDSEAIERHCFNLSSEPTREDWVKFFRDSVQSGHEVISDLVIWDPCTKEVWVNTGSRERPRKGNPLKKLPRTPRWVKKRFDVECP